jgi:prevent-host-death family protein
VTEIALYEAKAHLSALVDRVATTGEEIVITRRGHPVAKLSPVNDESALESALRHLLAARSESQPGPDRLRDLIDEGRR